MEMTGLTNSIIEHLIVSSALLFILGLLSSFVIGAFKIRGKAKLWICILLVIMPFIYPLKTLFPGPITVRVPHEIYNSVNFNVPDDDIAEKSNSADSQLSGRNDALYPHIHDPLNRSEQYTFFSLNWRSIALSAWVSLFLFFLIRMVILIRSMKKILKLADPVTDPEILNIHKQCESETGLKNIPLLKVDGIPAPMVMGFLNPAVILPGHLLGLQLREGLRFTLLHELKHLEQRHNWWLLAESIIGAAYFFHPVIHWAKRKIHEELEYVCDRHVVSVTNKSASYADFLLNEIWQQNPDKNPALALPFITTVSKTTARIHSIIKNVKPSLSAQIRSRFGLSLIAIIFASLLLCGLSPYSTIQEQASAGFKPLPEDNPIVTAALETIPQKEIPSSEKDELSIELTPPEIPSPGKEEKTAAPVISRTGQETIKDIIKEKGRTEPQIETAPEIINPPVPAASGNTVNTVHDDIRGIWSHPEPVNASIIYEGIKSVENRVLTGQIPLSEKTTPEDMVIMETAASKYLGSPVNELTIHRIENMKVLDSKTILFMMYGGNFYLSRLMKPCPALLYADSFNLVATLSRLTKFDRIEALSNGDVMGSSGMLGEFYPLKYKGSGGKAIKFLRNGVLDKLISEKAFKESFPAKV